MSEKKAKTPNVWETKGGFKPDWAHEIDVANTPGQRSDSERFEHALDMGITAAETLKRDEALGLMPSKERIRRRVLPVAIAALVCANILGVYIASYDDKNEVASQSEQKKVDDSIIQPETNNDGSYNVHATMVAGNKGKEDIQKIAIPEKATTGTELWVMRVHATLNQSSKYGPSCEMKLKFTDQNETKRKVTYRDYCTSTDQSSIDFLLPLFPNEEVVEYPLGKGDKTLIVTGKSAELDIDFLPASTIADTWNTSETLTGNETTIVAFSGSLADLKFHKFYCRADLYAYKPDLKKWVLLDKYSDDYTYQTGNIEKYGLDKDDISGYLFIEINGDWNDASWRLN